jgi:hypothetical protein
LIISRTHKFCFVHIPKCAGTHIRRNIQKYDEAINYTKRIDFHPSLGQIDYAHLPMVVLNKHFYSDFDFIKSNDSFAVLRDPYSRFYSAVSQHSKSLRGKALKDLSVSEIQEDVNLVISWLKQNGQNDIYPPDKIFFLPQHKYVYLDGQKIVKNLYTTKCLDLMINRIAYLIGNPITEIKSNDLNLVASNKSVTYRSGFTKLIFTVFVKSFVPFYKTVLPKTIINGLQNYLYKPAGNIFAEVIGTAEVNEFIKTFYQKDIMLYESVCIDGC